jgi:hypothetical protein
MEMSLSTAGPSVDELAGACCCCCCRCLRGVVGAAVEPEWECPSARDPSGKKTSSSVQSSEETDRKP